MNTTQRSAKRLITFLVAAFFLVGVTSVVAAYRDRRPLNKTTGLGGIDYFEDFFNGSVGTPFNVIETGNGAVQLDALVPGDHLTYIMVGSSGGPAFPEDGVGTAHLPALAFVGDGYTTTISTEAYLPYLSTGVLPFTSYFGLSGSSNYASPGSVAQAVFVYDSLVSDNWIIRGNTGTSVSPTIVNVVTNVPVDVNDFKTFKVILSGTTAYFFINAVQVGSIPNIIPSIVGAGASTVVDDGVAGDGRVVGFSMDYQWSQVTFPSPRPTP